MYRLSFLVALPFSLLLACQPAVSGPSNADKHDAATAATDAGSNTSDGGQNNDASHNRNDSGQANRDAMAADFGSFDIADFDAGMLEYDGGEEPGVVCGVNITCDLDSEICCAGMSTACTANDQQCPMFTLAIPCDGPEDCVGNEGGDTCCLIGDSLITSQISCTESSTCAETGAQVCNSSAECPNGFVCCSSEMLLNAGVEIGACKEGGC